MPGFQGFKYFFFSFFKKKKPQLILYKVEASLIAIDVCWINFVNFTVQIVIQLNTTGKKAILKQIQNEMLKLLLVNFLQIPFESGI